MNKKGESNWDFPKFEKYICESWFYKNIEGTEFPKDAGVGHWAEIPTPPKDEE